MCIWISPVNIDYVNFNKLVSPIRIKAHINSIPKHTYNAGPNGAHNSYEPNPTT